MKIRRLVRTTKRKVFLEHFYLNAFLSIFGAMGSIGTTYSNYDLTKGKRAGAWLGLLFSFSFLFLLIGAPVLLKLYGQAVKIWMICVLIVYPIFVIPFGIFYKVK